MATRRDFLKGLGGALGAVVLTSSCGSGGGSSSNNNTSLIPNGYRFFRVLTTGDPLPEGNTLFAMPGAAMINSRNELFVYGLDQADRSGFYELLLDFGGSRPAVLRARKVIREGDVLKDSKVVDQVTSGDVNDLGSFAAVVKTTDNLSGLYLERQKSGFEPVAGYLTGMPNGAGKFGSFFGDVDIHDNDNILFVAQYAPYGIVQGRQGLIYLPGGEVNEKGSIVTSTADLIPETGGFISGLGLVDMHDNGNYVLQAYGMSQAMITGQKVSAGAGRLDAEAASMLITGNVKDPFTRTLRSISSSIPVKKSTAARPGFTYGELRYGPRIGNSNKAAFVVHVNGSHMVMVYDGNPVISTGSLSPLGNPVSSVAAPVVGADGLLYYQAVTEQGMELVVYNGVDSKTILTNGDTVDGAVLRSLFFGFMTEQVDKAGRVVFTADFEDGNTSLVIGIPV